MFFFRKPLVCRDIICIITYLSMEAWKSQTNFEPNHSHDSLHRHCHKLSQAELSDGIFTFEKCDADSGGAISVALSKVVSTHLWSTPLDAFHSWLGDCLGCALGGVL